MRRLQPEELEADQQLVERAVADLFADPRDRAVDLVGPGSSAAAATALSRVRDRRPRSGRSRSSSPTWSATRREPDGGVARPPAGRSTVLVMQILRALVFGRRIAEVLRPPAGPGWCPR
ncbi:MAG: hypothetical protein R2862_11300 [Thermoanaerobaculia bacterium]